MRIQSKVLGMFHWNSDQIKIFNLCLVDVVEKWEWLCNIMRKYNNIYIFFNCIFFIETC